MHISTVTLPEMKLAGLPLAGPFSVLETDMPAVWSAFLERESELGETNGLRYGVSPVFIPDREPQFNGSVENFNGWFQPRLEVPA